MSREHDSDSFSFFTRGRIITVSTLLIRSDTNVLVRLPTQMVGHKKQESAVSVDAEGAKSI